jgi:hypothetical protein
MTWSADDEYRTRILARGRAILALRQPAAAYGVAAMGLMYAAGLLAAASGAAALEGVEAAGALIVPAGAATAAAALYAGPRLLRHEEKTSGTLVSRSALAWAIVGAAWAVVLAAPDVLEHAGHSFADLGKALAEIAAQGLAGALVGFLGGLAGGAAAAIICLERRA